MKALNFGRDVYARSDAYIFQVPEQVFYGTHVPTGTGAGDGEPVFGLHHGDENDRPEERQGAVRSGELRNLEG